MGLKLVDVVFKDEGASALAFCGAKGPFVACLNFENSVSHAPSSAAGGGMSEGSPSRMADSEGVLPQAAPFRMLESNEVGPMEASSRDESSGAVWIPEGLSVASNSQPSSSSNSIDSSNSSIVISSPLPPST